MSEGEELTEEELEELREKLEGWEEEETDDDKPLPPIATLVLILAVLTGSVVFGFLIYALLQVL